MDSLVSLRTYKLLYSCHLVYINTLKRSANTGINKYQLHYRLRNADKSDIVKSTLQDQNHTIQFKNIRVLSTTPHYYTHPHRKMIAIYNTASTTIENNYKPAVEISLLQNFNYQRDTEENTYNVSATPLTMFETRSSFQKFI